MAENGEGHRRPHDKPPFRYSGRVPAPTTPKPGSLTREIHANLIAAGKMKAEPLPTRDDLVVTHQQSRGSGIRGNNAPWEGRLLKKPWSYRATAGVVVCDTPDLLALCLSFIKAQTERPYIVVVDAGSTSANLAEVQKQRASNVEVHSLNFHGTRHAVHPVCYAMDLLLASCRTEYLWTVHSDCFVTDRELLASWVAQMEAGVPGILAPDKLRAPIGYQSMPRAEPTGDWKEMLSHTCSLFHVPTLDRLDAIWSMRRQEAQAAGPLLDTESAIGYRLKSKGVTPRIVGVEMASGIEVDEHRVHLRAATARAVHRMPIDDAAKTKERETLAWLCDLAAEYEQPVAKEVRERLSGEATTRKPGSQATFGEIVNTPASKKYQRPTRLNLIYHVAPFAKSDVWQKNVRQILRRIDLFNGQRVVAVSTGEGMSPMKEVVQAFDGARAGIKFLAVPNCRTMRENASFLPLLEAVQSTNPNEATFYAHAKGVTTIGDAEGVMYWRNLMYHALLDAPETIKDRLTEYATIGTHRKTNAVVYPDGATSSPWHFSGTYFWFRHDVLFGQRKWRDIPLHGWGVEAYPGLMFRVDESFCMAMPEPVNPYDPETYPPELRFADPDGAGTSAALKIELGGGSKPRDGFVNLDRCPTADHVIDFEADNLRFPFPDDAAHDLYSAHCLEHVRNLKGVLREIARVCAIGARVEIVIPSWFGNMAMCHDHKQTISQEQANHWGAEDNPTARRYWWEGSPKRLRLVETEYRPGYALTIWKRWLPQASDDELMRLCNDACHEVLFRFNVVANT